MTLVGGSGKVCKQLSSCAGGGRRCYRIRLFLNFTPLFLVKLPCDLSNRVKLCVSGDSESWIFVLFLKAKNN